MADFRELEAGDPEWLGRYRILARLGRGGMGRVFLGRSPSGRAVAVKVVHTELAEDPGFRRRFVREVEAARRVTGFFTAAVVDADPEGDPAWLATAYVPGLALDEAVAEHGVWPAESVLALGAALAEALEAIHGAEVVHRDLKPSNVLLAADGPRVIDFGISLAAEGTVLTQTGAMVGTPGFISPEQLVGRHVGPPSDVFALGAVLAYAATGSGPFGHSSGHALNYRVVHEEPDLDALPPGLGVVARCLAKDPEQRPTVPELLAELVRAAPGGRSTGPLTEAGWLPAPVAAAIRERTNAPELPWRDRGADASAPPAPVSSTPPPFGTPPPPAAAPSEPGPGARAGRRRAVYGGLAIAVALVLAVTVGTVIGRLSSDDGSEESASEGTSDGRTGEGGTGEGGTDEGGTGEGDPAEGGTSAGTDPTDPEDPAAAAGQRWAFGLGGWVCSDPAVADGVVYAGSDGGGLHAVDAATGEGLWSFRTDAVLCGSPTVVEGVVYAGSDDGFVYAVDAATGDELWSFATDGAVRTAPAVADGLVYAGSDAGNFYAVDAATGDPRWMTDNNESVHSAPVVVDGTVYFGSGDDYVNALDAATGEVRWYYTTDGDVNASPAVVDGMVYVGSDDGKLYALDAAAGTVVWSFTAAGAVNTAPAVADGVVYAGSDAGTVHAVDLASGEERWVFRAEGWVRSSPAVADGVVYFGSDDGNVYAVDAAGGEELWAYPTGGWVRSSPTVVDGTVYVGSDDGNLYALAPE